MGGQLPLPIPSHFSIFLSFSFGMFPRPVPSLRIVIVVFVVRCRVVSLPLRLAMPKLRLSGSRRRVGSCKDKQCTRLYYHQPNLWFDHLSVHGASWMLSRFDRILLFSSCRTQGRIFDVVRVDRSTYVVVQTMLFAALAMRGHSSAHSLATGPVMADPFISPFGLTMTPALSSKYTYSPSFLLHGLRWRITTAGITVRFFFFIRTSLGQPRHAIARVLTRASFASSRGCPSVRFVGEVFARTFLSQVGLSFLDTGHHHVTCCRCWESVQPRSPSDHGDHVQVLGTGVVGAVHHRTHRQRQRHAELVARSTSSSCTSSSATSSPLPRRSARVARHLAPRFDIVADDAHVRAEWRRWPPMDSSTPLPIRVAPCSSSGRSPKRGHTNARRDTTLGGEENGERSERKGRNGREPDEEGGCDVVVVSPGSRVVKGRGREDPRRCGVVAWTGAKRRWPTKPTCCYESNCVVRFDVRMGSRKQKEERKGWERGRPWRKRRSRKRCPWTSTKPRDETRTT